MQFVIFWQRVAPVLKCVLLLGSRLVTDELNGKQVRESTPNACAAPATVSECGFASMPL